MARMAQTTNFVIGKWTQIPMAGNCLMKSKLWGFKAISDYKWPQDSIKAWTGKFQNDKLHRKCALTNACLHTHNECDLLPRHPARTHQTRQISTNSNVTNRPHSQSVTTSRAEIYSRNMSSVRSAIRSCADLSRDLAK